MLSKKLNWKVKWHFSLFIIFYLQQIMLFLYYTKWCELNLQNFFHSIFEWNWKDYPFFNFLKYDFGIVFFLYILKVILIMVKQRVALCWIKFWSLFDSFYIDNNFLNYLNKNCYICKTFLHWKFRDFWLTFVQP